MVLTWGVQSVQTVTLTAVVSRWKIPHLIAAVDLTLRSVHQPLELWWGCNRVHSATRVMATPDTTHPESQVRSASTAAARSVAGNGPCAGHDCRPLDNVHPMLSSSSLMTLCTLSQTPECGTDNTNPGAQFNTVHVARDSNASRPSRKQCNFPNHLRPKHLPSCFSNQLSRCTTSSSWKESSAQALDSQGCQQAEGAAGEKAAYLCS